MVLSPDPYCAQATTSYLELHALPLCICQLSHKSRYMSCTKRYILSGPDLSCIPVFGFHKRSRWGYLATIKAELNAGKAQPGTRSGDVILESKSSRLSVVVNHRRELLGNKPGPGAVQVNAVEGQAQPSLGRFGVDLRVSPEGQCIERDAEGMPR